MASLNAYYAGRNAARHGGKCPFTEKGPLTEKKLREAWLAGYRRAKAELNPNADTAWDADDPR
jgi:ribosome modulation factor